MPLLACAAAVLMARSPPDQYVDAAHILADVRRSRGHRRAAGAHGGIKAVKCQARLICNSSARLCSGLLAQPGDLFVECHEVTDTADLRWVIGCRPG